MFERFTASAREVVVGAQEEARELGHLDLRAARAGGRRLDRRIHDRMPQLLGAAVRPRTPAQAAHPAGGLDPHERAGAVVERITHAPRLLALAVSDVRQHRFACQLDGSGTIIIREPERLNLRHTVTRRQSDLNMSLVGA